MEELSQSVTLIIPQSEPQSQVLPLLSQPLRQRAKQYIQAQPHTQLIQSQPSTQYIQAQPHTQLIQSQPSAQPATTISHPETITIEISEPAEIDDPQVQRSSRQLIKYRAREHR